MIQTSVTPLLVNNVLQYLITEAPNGGSILGRIVGHSATHLRLTQLREQLLEVIDFLPVPTAAHIIEHKTFGIGIPICRMRLSNGADVVSVNFNDTVVRRNIILDPAYWITPIESILQEVKEIQPAIFKFPDKSPIKMDRGYQAMPIGVHVRPKEPKHVDYVTVHSDGEAQLLKRSAFPHSHKMPALRKNFCPVCVEVACVNGVPVCEERKGVYTPIKHECPKVWLRDCKSFVPTEQPQQRKEEQEQEESVNPTEVIEGVGEIPSMWAGELPSQVFSVGGSLEVERMEKPFAVRVSSTGFQGMNVDENAVERNVKDRRSDHLLRAKRPERYIPTTRGICKRTRCRKGFDGPKGQLYCTPNCCKRHNEEK